MRFVDKRVDNLLRDAELLCKEVIEDSREMFATSRLAVPVRVKLNAEMLLERLERLASERNSE